MKSTSTHSMLNTEQRPCRSMHDAKTNTQHVSLNEPSVNIYIDVCLGLGYIGRITHGTHCAAVVSQVRSAQIMSETELRTTTQRISSAQIMSETELRTTTQRITEIQSTLYRRMTRSKMRDHISESQHSTEQDHTQHCSDMHHTFIVSASSTHSQESTHERYTTPASAHVLLQLKQRQHGGC
jgi:hypothetical protein